MARKDQFVSFVVKSTDTLAEVFVLYLGIIALASFSFHLTEGMSYMQALWLSFVTATSTGYGDVAPKTMGGQLTAVLLMHVTIFVIIPLAVARILSVAIQDRNAFTDEEQQEVLTLLREIRERKD